MKTRFILHGGYASTRNDSNDAYFTEMINCAGDGGTILLVCFAWPDDVAREKYKKDTQYIQALCGGKTVSTLQATRAHFIAEVHGADVIYLRGGSTEKLNDALRAYPDFFAAIKGKVIAGDSAGAYVLSQYYFTNSLRKVMQGLGCVPTRVVCHHQSNIHPIPTGINPVQELEKYDNDLELIVLKDFEWVIRDVEL